MVDKKTGLKPKTVKSPKPKVQSKQPKEEKLAPQKAAPEKLENLEDTKQVIVEEPKTEEKLTKAGKHSAKALKEAEELKAKEERKKQAAEAEAKGEKPKIPLKPPRSRVERAGKKYREVAKLVDKSKTYKLAEALELAVRTNPTKFDAAVELHVNLGVDPKQADHNVRDSLALPAGTGKNVRIAVFAEADEAAKAKAAGADIVGAEDFLQQLDKEQLNFDVLISTPALMPRLAKYARLLGPRGLMPNPKSGTITNDLAKAVTEARAGRVEYRVDPAGIVHMAIGKVSFGSDKLLQNAEAFFTSLRAAKPASLKGIYIKSSYLSTTMGPSIRIAL